MFYKSVISLLLLIICNLSSFGQGVDTVITQKKLFLHGIYLEDLDVTIPWQADFESIKKYGNPTIDTISKRNYNVHWDSTIILGDVFINLRYPVWKSFFGRGKWSKLTTIYGTINRKDIEKIKHYLNMYSNKDGKYSEWKHSNVYHWEIDGCNIRLGYWKGRWKEYGSFLDVQKK